jgi:hypothetical protein
LARKMVTKDVCTSTAKMMMIEDDMATGMLKKQ